MEYGYLRKGSFEGLWDFVYEHKLHWEISLNERFWSSFDMCISCWASVDSEREGKFCPILLYFSFIFWVRDICMYWHFLGRKRTPFLEGGKEFGMFGRDAIFIQKICTCSAWSRVCLLFRLAIVFLFFSSPIFDGIYDVLIFFFFFHAYDPFWGSLQGFPFLEG